MIPEVAADEVYILSEKLNNQLVVLKQGGQFLLDLTTPHLLWRWVFTFLITLLYVLRVWWVTGFHIVSYTVSIYGVNLFIRFLSPQVDPESYELSEPEDGLLPTKQDDEFRPFLRQIPEFNLWFSLTRAVFLSILATFLPFLNVPFFWPALLLYFVVLFVITMKELMARHRCIPFTIDKPKHSDQQRKPSLSITEHEAYREDLVESAKSVEGRVFRKGL